MRLWGIRGASMENPIVDLTCFEAYQNRQVILNYYEEEDLLWKREGFHFISIKVDNKLIIFNRKQGVFTFSAEEYPIVMKNNDFQHYYILFAPKLGSRLEIYFS
jgi:hypothetical protein